MLNAHTEPCCPRSVTNRNITSSIASAYKSKNVTVFIIDLLIDQFLYVARLRNGNYWWLLNFYQSPFT